MAKVPRFGPDYSRLCDLLAKVHTAEPLNDDERVWLVRLLDDVRVGRDVAKRFTRNRKLRPMAERDFWLALDVAEHVHAERHPAYRLVAERWNMSSPSAEETLKKIVQRQRANLASMRSQIEAPNFSAVVDYHRARLIGRKSL